METHYGGKDLERYAEAVGVDYGTLKDYRRVSAAYENGERSTFLSWGHHRVLAARPDRGEWLKRAEAEGMSIPRLREAMGLGMALVDAGGLDEIHEALSAAPHDFALSDEWFRRITGEETAEAETIDGSVLTVLKLQKRAQKIGNVIAGENIRYQRMLGAFMALLKESGIDWDLAIRRMRVAAVPDAVFEAYLAETKEAEKLITVEGLLAYAAKARAGQGLVGAGREHLEGVRR